MQIEISRLKPKNWRS